MNLWIRTEYSNQKNKTIFRMKTVMLKLQLEIIALRKFSPYQKFQQYP